MKKYLKPITEVIELPEVMCSCGCHSCTKRCKCHDPHWPGHNPHHCHCSTYNYRFEPEKEDNINLEEDYYDF